MSGGGGAVQITNWGDMDLHWADMEGPAQQAQMYVWNQTQANADTWASNANTTSNNWIDAYKAKWSEDNSLVQGLQSTWTTTWAAAQAAYALAQTTLAKNALDAATDAAGKQYDIANRQQTIADDEYTRYTQHYAPCEDNTVDFECKRTVPYTEDIETECARATADVRKQFSLLRQQLLRRQSRYCMGAAAAQERTLAIEEAVAVAAAKERVRRFLEEREFNRDTAYFNRKLQLFNIGRGLKADALAEMRGASASYELGSETELAARNQYYGAVLSSVGGLIGAALPMVNSSPMPAQRSSFGIGGISNEFGSTTSFGFDPKFGGAPLLGVGGLGATFTTNGTGAT